MKKTTALFLTFWLSAVMLTPFAIHAQDEISQTQVEQVVEAPEQAPAIAIQPGQAVVAADESAISDGDLLKAFAQTVMDIYQVTKKEGLAKVTLVCSILFAIIQFLIMFLKSNHANQVFKKWTDLQKIAVIALLTTLSSGLALGAGGASIWAILGTGGVGTLLIMGIYRVWQAFKGTKPETEPS